MPVFVLSRRQLLVWLFLAVIYGGGADAAAWAQADDPAFRAQRFIQALGLDLIDAAADQTLTRATRSERLRTLFHRGFDSPSIARFVLGRYWTVATPAERQEYLTLFEDMVVRFCARRFNLARGAAFRVTGGRPESDRDVVVVTELWLAKGRPVSVAQNFL